jgi:hypothetical protein
MRTLGAPTMPGAPGTSGLSDEAGRRRTANILGTARRLNS